MTENRLSDYLSHMLDAADQACAYIEGMEKEDFLTDKRTQQAVILNIVMRAAVQKSATVAAA